MSNAQPISPAVLERLWSKVDIRNSDECWPFRGYRLKGYGRLGIGTKVYYANRIVAEATHGPAPSPQHQARHLCGNRACCNPGHIAWGTQSDNEMDKVAHGLSNRGDRHGMSRLTADQVREIRRRIAAGEAHGSIAYWFGVSNGTISDIRCGHTWGWLDRESVT